MSRLGRSSVELISQDSKIPHHTFRNHQRPMSYSCLLCMIFRKLHLIHSNTPHHMRCINFDHTLHMFQHHTEPVILIIVDNSYHRDKPGKVMLSQKSRYLRDTHVIRSLLQGNRSLQRILCIQIVPLKNKSHPSTQSV